MMQADLNFDAPVTRTLCDRMAQYFRLWPGDWLDVTDLAAIGGIGGWRTRVSDLRRPKFRGGRYEMTIEQRLIHWPDGRNRSQYRYVPAGAPGRAA
jgi:hypothetical protein